MTRLPNKFEGTFRQLENAGGKPTLVERTSEAVLLRSLSRGPVATGIRTLRRPWRPGGGRGPEAEKHRPTTVADFREFSGWMRADFREIDAAAVGGERSFFFQVRREK